MGSGGGLGRRRFGVIVADAHAAFGPIEDLRHDAGASHNSRIQ